jgi:hypothetical protein
MDLRVIALTKHCRQLRLGKMLGNASMGAESISKRILSRPLSVHVEFIGVLKNVCITVGRLIRGNDAFVCLDMLGRVSLNEY